ETMSGGAGPASGALSYGPFLAGPAFVEVFAGRRAGFGAGERGPHVKTLEQTLVALGYGLPGGAPPDVAFGPGTKSALTRFQREKGIAQSGVLDRPTLEALDRAAVAKKLGGAAAGAAKRPDTVALMRQLLAEAREGGGIGGSRITGDEARRALDALRWDDGAISPAEYAAAKAELDGEAFQRGATPEAKALAADFLRKHAAKATPPPADTGFKVRKLDGGARDALLGKSKLGADIQAAEAKLDAAAAAKATSPEGVGDVVKRAFGGGAAVDPFAPTTASELEALLARGVAGHARPSAAEVGPVIAALARVASGGGALLAADWKRGSQEAGTYVVAVKPGGGEALLLDVFRRG
ncbi:MAG TPA: peptidoglycan-binding domain-containing protein, partial [Planctomycetota bacterium]|nr:peptidoglycan-binding domain-containing protein [Planctomycetota bacterium]